MLNMSFGLLGEVQNNHCDVVVDFPLFTLRFCPQLLHSHLRIVGCLLQTFVYQNAGHILDGIFPEDISHFLPAQLVPESIRCQNHRLMLAGEWEGLDFGDGSDVISREVLEGSLVLHFARVVLGVVELSVLKSEIADGARGLQPPLYVARFVVILLANHHIFLVGEQRPQTLLLFGIVGVQLPVQLGEAHRRIIVDEDGDGISCISAVQAVVVDHADQSTRASPARSAESWVRIGVPYL